MKKQLLIFYIFAFAVTTAYSQITITSSDVPSAGTFSIEAIDTTVTTVSLSTGANQTWNYSTWQNQKQDTTSFVNPQTLSGYSDFPGSNLAINSANIGGADGDIFLSNSSNELDILGFYANFGMGQMAIQLTPAQKFLSFPTTYQSTFNGTSKFVLQFAGQPPADSVKVISTIIYSSDIDGWGTITTPSYSNVNSLRQKYTEINIDSTFIYMFGSWSLDTFSGQPNPKYDTIISYRWWSNTLKGPVAEFQTDQNGIVGDVKYLLSTQVGIIKNSSLNHEVKIFPNPAAEKIYITGLTALSGIVIFDATGRLMENSLLKKSNSSINISGFGNGMYFYQVVDISGNALSNGKFAVAR